MPIAVISYMYMLIYVDLGYYRKRFCCQRIAFISYFVHFIRSFFENYQTSSINWKITRRDTAAVVKLPSSAL